MLCDTMCHLGFFTLRGPHTSECMSWRRICVVFVRDSVGISHFTLSLQKRMKSSHVITNIKSYIYVCVESTDFIIMKCLAV